MFGLEKVIHRLNAMKPADPALSISACLDLGQKAVVAVHPDRAEL